jgi:hypothetical protein
LLAIGELRISGKKQKPVYKWGMKAGKNQVRDEKVWASSSQSCQSRGEKGFADVPTCLKSSAETFSHG